jgi:hypothetical protein
MSVAYCTTTQFSDATTGAMTADLPAGSLQQYIYDASAAIEQHCQRSFVQQSGVVETVWSGGQGRAVIGNNGFVSLYPLLAFPISTSPAPTVVWRLRTPSLVDGASASSSQSVAAADIVVDVDNFGEGWRILLFQDFGQYRDPAVPVQFTVTYSGGYATYPDWLTRACILWTMGLLRRRDGPQIVVTGDQVRDMSSSSSEIREAKALLARHVRTF